MEKNNKTPKQREEARKTQLEILKSISLRGLMLANAGRDKARYGEAGEQATHDIDYLNALSNPDKYLGQVIANAFSKAEQEAGENYGGAVVPTSVLKTAEAFYFGGLDNLKVSDMLELMGSEVSEDAISKSQKNMYMEDFKEKNKEAYEKIISVYVSYTQMAGVGKAITEKGKSLTGNLEKILMQPVNDNQHLRETA